MLPRNDNFRWSCFCSHYHRLKAQIKHINNFSIKNFGPPKTPPQKKEMFMFGLFLYFEGKGGPKHKEFLGSGVPWRGGDLGGGFLANCLCLCLFSGPEGLHANAHRMYTTMFMVAQHAEQNH